MFLGTSRSMSERRHLPSTTLRVALPHVAFLLAFAIAMHQFVMATPAHAAIMPMMAHDMQMHGPMQTSPNCPLCPIHTIAVCPAVQAALLVGMSAVFFLAAMSVAIAFALRGTEPGVIASADWRPPPKCTLALLQTFRC